MKIVSIAALKRLKVGTVVILMDAQLGESPWIYKDIGIPRKIEVMQTNAIKFEGGSWLYFPKAKYFEPTEDGFKILPVNDWDPLLEYRVEGKKK